MKARGTKLLSLRDSIISFATALGVGIFLAVLFVDIVSPITATLVSLIVRRVRTNTKSGIFVILCVNEKL
jgi:hypothetical protein|nr:MAG TPA: hypothetical protein [Caudoviricetes sp.]